MIPRGHGDPLRFRDEGASAFNALDQRVDMFALAKVHGPRIFDIFRLVYEASDKYPGSLLFNVFAGTATKEQLETVFAGVTIDLSHTDALLEAIVCNDAAPAAMLEHILKNAVTMWAAAWKAAKRRTLAPTSNARRGNHPHRLWQLWSSTRTRLMSCVRS